MNVVIVLVPREMSIHGTLHLQRGEVCDLSIQVADSDQCNFSFLQEIVLTLILHSQLVCKSFMTVVICNLILKAHFMHFKQFQVCR